MTEPLKFVYSLIRFVPDPARGEFMNVGAVAGSEESSEWDIRQIGNPRRARALGSPGALGAVWSFMDQVGAVFDEYQENLHQLFDAETIPSENWLNGLHRYHRNIVQLSPPTPMIADTVEEALDSVFSLLIVDPDHRRYTFRKKTKCWPRSAWHIGGSR